MTSWQFGGVQRMSVFGTSKRARSFIGVRSELKAQRTSPRRQGDHQGEYEDGPRKARAFQPARHFRDEFHRAPANDVTLPPPDRVVAPLSKRDVQYLKGAA